MRRILFTIVTLALLASACSGDDPVAEGDGGGDTPTTSTPERNDDGELVVEIDGDELVLTSGLSGFGDCDALLDHLRTEAGERVGPWGFESGGWFGGPVPMRAADTFDDDDMAEEDEMVEEEPSAEASAPAFDQAVETTTTADAVEGVDFSGTNVQELGVDEADIIKTDGERIYLVAAGQLVVVDVDERVVIGATDIPQSWNSELFLAGDELLLVGSAWLDRSIGIAYPEVGGDAESSFADDVAIAEPWYGSNVVRVTRISIDGSGEPEIVGSMVVEGDYVSARAVDGVARVVVRSNPQYNFPFVYPQSESGEAVAAEANQNAVRQSELSDWLPSYGVEDADGTITDSGLLPDCGAVHAPTEFAGFGILSVLSVPVTGELDARDTTSVLAPGDLVYGSTESIFVATPTWPDWGILEDDGDAWEDAWNARHTSIHRFALSDTGAAYTASGSVPGDVRNQFSFSEYDGHLRVVTTTGDTWDETSESFVRVLRETDGELVEVGSVGDMGNGEAVQSVRFVGDVGYVVTFRQIDPFYTLDLRDPENPKVVGELKIPGFSSYLHPIGEGRVLGVGSDADLDGRVTGSKVSIFDVSDPANPLEVSVWQAPGAWNDIGWEHRSFLWWAPEQIAVVPVNVWENGQNWAGAVVLQVEGSTITEIGRIDHLDEGAERGSTECDVLTEDDLPTTDMSEFDSEIEYMIADGYGLVLSCADGESRTASGFQCFDEPWLRDEADRVGLDIPTDDTLVMCWDEGYGAPIISRTMVINADELWTLSSTWGYPSPDSPARLQINDIASLDRLDHLTIG
ncbi:MAG: beta-propeller domain-containing protein [Actinomycetota bacterium]